MAVIQSLSVGAQLGLLSVRLSDTTRDHMGITALMDACSAGLCSKDVKRVLHTFEPQSIDKSDVLGRNALHYAAMRGRVSVVELLIDLGLNTDARDTHGHTPLALSLISRKFDAAHVLIPRSDLSIVTKKKENVLLLLAKSKKWSTKLGLGVVRRLLSIDSRLVACCDNRGCTALFYAASDKPQLCALLLSVGADTHARDEFGRTCLFSAVYANNAEVCELLLRHGCAVNVRDEFGHSPLMLACCFGELQTVQTLIANGAEVNAKVATRHGHYSTALTLSIRHDSWDVANWLVSNAQIDFDVCICDTETETETKTDTDTHLYPKTLWDFVARDCNDPCVDVDTFDAFEQSQKSINHAGFQGNLEVKRQLVCRRRELLENMRKADRKKKKTGLMQSQIVDSLAVPTDIVAMIADPIKW